MINIEEHLGLARKVAFEYYRKLQEKYTYDELESTAYMGLIKAANNFNESKGFKHRRWECLCECGNVVQVNQDSLLSEKTKSCGCLHKAVVKKIGHENKGKYIKNIIGEKFGRLTVLSMTDKIYKSNGTVIWECLCECGKKVEVASKHLNSKMVQSCGCLTVESARKNQVLATNSDRYKGTKVNLLTKKKPTTNTSGYKGVGWNKKSNKWRARIVIAGKEINLGFYENIEDAIRARKVGEEKYFNPIIEEFFNTNRGDKNEQHIITK